MSGLGPRDAHDEEQGADEHAQAAFRSGDSLVRSPPSPPEELLWSALRNRKLGVSFRRQVPLAGYICDFACASCKLVVEVDGAHHARRAAADARRDRVLARLGYRVLRIEARAVLRELPVAVQRVRAAL